VSDVPDLGALLPYRQVLSELERASGPSAAVVCGAEIRDARQLVAVPGSFNPPHLAHTALLLAGLAASGASAGAFTLSRHTVDKERVHGLLLEDRLWLLCQLLADLQPAGGPRLTASLGVVATSGGLYVEQATALRHLCPRLERVVFVVGFDKIVQIFDRRYYAEPERALDDLFAQASFLVAPRQQHTAEDLQALLEQPANRRYATGVVPLAVDPALAHISSTAAREAAAAGEPIDGLVPPRVARFVAASDCFRQLEGQGRYAARVAALEAL
jgi:nicotinamide-nucleotide adenylyltransferase